MTSEVERQLEQLIAKFGYENVCDALAPLVAKCAFKDWLCVANAAGGRFFLNSAFSQLIPYHSLVGEWQANES
jgi:hypothetical protein